jgi:hypothetical protein
VLAKILQDNLPENEAENAETLARRCAENEPDAVDKVNNVLDGIRSNMDDIVATARDRKAKELVHDYVRRDPDTVVMINELLTQTGRSIDAFMAEALVEKLDYIERIDRRATIAENRRNASLTEIERRRAVFGATLRQSVEKIEDAEFKVIDATPPKGKNAH